jgi:hypothetical protein
MPPANTGSIIAAAAPMMRSPPICFMIMSLLPVSRF